MYHAIVRRKLRLAFEHINRGEYGKVIAQFATEHRHRFPGDHPLGGERTDLTTTGLWYRRLARIFPDLRFDVQRIVVSGWPWDTVAYVEWRDRFSLPNGAEGTNEGVHVLRMRWGAVTELTIFCDTTRLARACALLAESGVSDASAPFLGLPA